MSYLHIGYPLTILSCSDAYLPWLHSNFIQLFVTDRFPHSKDDNNVFCFYYHSAYPLIVCPLLDIQWCDISLFAQDSVDIVPCLLGFINRGYYTQLFVDEFYVPSRSVYRLRRHVHEVLVVGYDLSQRVFYVLGYNENGRYALSAIAFTDLVTALGSAWESGKAGRRYIHGKIWLARYSDGSRCVLDLLSVVEQLQDLLTSSNTTSRFRMINCADELGAYRETVEAVYGIRTYGYLDAYLAQLATDECRYDEKAFAVLWEHKKCMRDRVQYFECKKHLAVRWRMGEQWSQIERRAAVLRMMVLKFGLRREADLVMRSRDRLHDLASEEKILLSRLIDALSSPSGGVGWPQADGVRQA